MKVSLSLIPAQLLTSISQRYVLDNSSAAGKIASSSNATAGRRLLQTSPLPSPPLFLSNWSGFLSYDDDYSLEPATVAAPAPVLPAANITNLTAQQSIAGFAFDLLQPDTGNALQDDLPKEPGIYTFAGEAS
jgi:hypothetical protein